MSRYVAVGKTPYHILSVQGLAGQCPHMKHEDRPYMDIALRIRWHRDFEGHDQSAYGDRAGLKRTAINNYENGMKRISLDAARALCKAYDLSLDWIYEGDDGNLPAAIRKAWRERPSGN